MIEKNTEKKALKKLKKKNYAVIEELGFGSYGDVISIKSKRNNKRLAETNMLWPSQNFLQYKPTVLI